jgi:hypothetical protein
MAHRPGDRIGEMRMGLAELTQETARATEDIARRVQTIQRDTTGVSTAAGSTTQP